jgi:hypothetical protein
MAPRGGDVAHTTLNAAIDALSTPERGATGAYARPGRRGSLAPPLRPLARRAAAFLLLGAAANVAVAAALALFLDISAGRVESAGSWTGRSQWTVTKWSRPGGAYVLSVREPGANWSPGQATGQPDTASGGDQVTAWASQSADGGSEWLLLDYAEPVVPKAVRVFETCATGAVDRITVFDPAGNEVEAWAGTDPTPKSRPIGMSEIPLKPLGFKTQRVRIRLDSASVPSWNEIDAVGLVGSDDQVHWAIGAEASSTYASSVAGTSVGGAGASELAPQWSDLSTPTDDLQRGNIRREERAVEARGWPMLSVWGRVPSTRVQPTPTTPIPGSAANTSVMYLSGRLLVTGATPARGPTVGETPLMAHPIWPGFLVNSAFYAVILAGLYWALVIPRRFVREVGRMRRGCCVACGYDLGFDFVPGCPECGWRRQPAPGTGR